MNKQWVVEDISAEEEALALEISVALTLNPIVSRLLVKRGVTSVSEARSFIDPKLNEQPNPYLMYGMDKAVSYLQRTMRSRKPIMITGDRDVDGVTSVALIHNALRDVFGYDSKLLHCYIPGGNDVGYGISRNCIEDALMSDCQLLIAVDTGIKAIKEVDYARSLGLEVIICDHHQADDTLPAASAILNPKLKECAYPNTHLSACGVAYKFMQALAIAENKELSKLYNYLDLLAISTAADLVPLIRENRAFLIHGLHQLNSHPCIGIKALLELSNIGADEHIDMGSIIYKIAPRLNAAGRMQDGQVSVDLLTASTEKQAYEICKKLEAYNLERRNLDMRITEEAETMIEQVPNLDKRSILILYQPDWHSGVMGIVAARIAERYNRPTIILTKIGDNVVGSGRASSPINLYAALESCRDLLINFGGHKYAAGLTIKEEKLPELKRRLEQFILSQHYEDADAQSTLKIDAVLRIEDITLELAQDIGRLAPFGLNNNCPLFATYRLRDAGGSKAVGKEGQHLRLRMTDRYCRYKPLSGIALNQSEHTSWVMSQQSFAICYNLEKNTYFRSPGLQLKVKDIQTKIN